RPWHRVVQVRILGTRQMHAPRCTRAPPDLSMSRRFVRLNATRAVDVPLTLWAGARPSRATWVRRVKLTMPNAEVPGVGAEVTRRSQVRDRRTGDGPWGRRTRGGVGLAPFVVHARQHRNADVDIVVDFDACLG